MGSIELMENAYITMGSIDVMGSGSASVIQ